MRLRDNFEMAMNKGEQCILEISALTAEGNTVSVPFCADNNGADSAFIVDSFTCIQQGSTAPLFVLDGMRASYGAGVFLRSEVQFLADTVILTGTAVGQAIGIIIIGRYVNRRKITSV